MHYRVTVERLQDDGVVDLRLICRLDATNYTDPANFMYALEQARESFADRAFALYARQYTTLVPKAEPQGPNPAMTAKG